MAVALVQQATGTQAAGANCTATLGAVPSAGSLLVAVIGNNAGVGTGITGGGGGTWTLASRSTSHQPGEIWYSENCSGSGGTSITASFSGAGASAINVSEWSGCATISSLDKTNSGTGSDAAPATGSITPTASNVIIGMFAIQTTLSTGPSNGFTALTAATVTGANTYGAYLVQTSPASISTDWTVGVADGWDAAIADFFAASGGPATYIDAGIASATAAAEF